MPRIEKPMESPPSGSGTEYRTGTSGPKTQYGVAKISWSAWKSLPEALPLSFLDPGSTSCLQVRAGTTVLTLECRKAGGELHLRCEKVKPVPISPGIPKPPAKPAPPRRKPPARKNSSLPKAARKSASARV